MLVQRVQQVIPAKLYRFLLRLQKKNKKKQPPDFVLIENNVLQTGRFGTLSIDSHPSFGPTVNSIYLNSTSGIAEVTRNTKRASNPIRYTVLRSSYADWFLEVVNNGLFPMLKTFKTCHFQSNPFFIACKCSFQKTVSFGTFVQRIVHRIAIHCFLPYFPLDISVIHVLKCLTTFL